MLMKSVYDCCFSQSSGKVSSSEPWVGFVVRDDCVGDVGLAGGVVFGKVDVNAAVRALRPVVVDVDVEDLDVELDEGLCTSKARMVRLQAGNCSLLSIRRVQTLPPDEIANFNVNFIR